jgi:hypothetical protein
VGTSFDKRPDEEWLSIFVLLVQVVCRGQIVECFEDFHVLRPKCCLLDCYGSTEELFGFSVLMPFALNACQVAEQCRGAGVLTSE